MWSMSTRSGAQNGDGCMGILSGMSPQTLCNKHWNGTHKGEGNEDIPNKYGDGALKMRQKRLDSQCMETAKQHARDRKKLW